MKLRKEQDLPKATAEWGWKYHHLGVPTKDKKENERYLKQFKMYVSDFPTSPFGIEFMRFELDSPIHPLIQSKPHLAFEVDDLEQELAKHNLKLLGEPNFPEKGIKVAMIEFQGMPLELIEFSN